MIWILCCLIILLSKTVTTDNVARAIAEVIAGTTAEETLEEFVGEQNISECITCPDGEIVLWGECYDADEITDDSIFELNKVTKKIKASINRAEAIKTGGLVFLKNQIGLVLIVWYIKEF